MHLNGPLNLIKTQMMHYYGPCVKIRLETSSIMILIKIGKLRTTIKHAAAFKFSIMSTRSLVTLI